MKCLFNSESNNCCGYCKYHLANLTVKQMRAKECLQKECRYLVKNESHSYWKQREIIKQKKKIKKQILDDYIMSFNGGIKI